MIMNKKNVMKNKRAQDKKSKMFSLHSKRAQEEMIGFAFIIIIVAVVLLIFVSFALMGGDESAVESYEIESFIVSTLQYTTECEDFLGSLSIQEVIYKCDNQETCLNGEKACDILKDTLEGILDTSWQIENRPEEAYELDILLEGQSLVSISKGNKTGNFKGSTIPLPKKVNVIFNVYY